MMRALFCTLALALLAGCASSSAEAPPASAGQVDLQRYQGTWYELARLPKPLGGLAVQVIRWDIVETEMPLHG